MKEAIAHYEAALKEAFPSGATGNVFHHWNEARKALEQPAQQEPVAFASHGIVNWIADKQFQHEADLYTAPQRPWVGLTQDEQDKVFKTFSKSDAYKRDFLNRVASAIEAKLKEKNT